MRTREFPLTQPSHGPVHTYRYIADGILRGLFGFMPGLDVGQGALLLKNPHVARGFEGTLHHIRYQGELWAISADGNGVRATKE